MANLWTTGERNAFDYLLTQLTETENQTAFLGELPANFKSETYDYEWCFKLTGPGEVDDVGAGQGVCGINLDGMIEGIFINREDAQEFAVNVKALLPVASTTITNVQDLRMTAEPTLSLGVEIERDSDQEKAGNIRTWVIEIPLKAVLKS